MTTTRKGIVLAGGSGTRLYPITHGVSKQLLPLYNKPMIYYALAVPMLAGVREIALITTPDDQPAFRKLLGNGARWGLRIEYVPQPRPDGLAQAYILTEEFLGGAPSLMTLGDNIFYGHGLQELLAETARADGGVVFGYHVHDPERYGVVTFDADERVVDITEKPEKPRSNYALTGLYFLDGRAPAFARAVRPSPRGELEIVDVLRAYLEDGALSVRKMGRGFGWLDTGTHDSLMEAGEFVRTVEKRQGLMIGCPEEIAFRQGWIDAQALEALAQPYLKTEYGRYLVRVAREAA